MDALDGLATEQGPTTEPTILPITMSRGSISTDPRDRLGAFKSLDQVPDQHRLRAYRDTYRDRDVWQEFLTNHLFETHHSDRFKEDARRAGRYWKDHMADRVRHHALATPDDVETWMETLLDGRTLGTAYNGYWVRIERFYDWLVWHTDHPHLYNPVLMAAAKGGAASTVWEEKMSRRDGETND